MLAPGAARAHNAFAEQATQLTQAVTLDGVLSPGEWDEAATFSIPAIPTGSEPGQVWTKYDESYVYFALRAIDLLDPFEFEFQVYFDNAHDGVASTGDDIWSAGLSGGSFFARDWYYDGGFQFDSSAGGTNDTEGGATYTAGTGEAIVELRHPRCSSDFNRDICMPGDGSLVGIDVAYTGSSFVLYPSGSGDQSGYGHFSLELPPPPAPELSISDASVTEGDSGTTNLEFTVTRSGDLTGTTTVDFNTAGASASDPLDYVFQAGGLTFGPGDAQETITVLVNGDTDAELDESMFVFLFNEIGATIADSLGQGTILDDDASPITFVVSTITELEDAVAAANDNVGPDTIEIQPGHYQVVNTLYVTGDLMVDGPAGDSAVLDGGNESTVFNTSNNADLSLDDLTIKNADLAIYGFGDELHLNRVTIVDDVSSGIWTSGLNLTTVTNSTFSGNDVGIYHESGDLVLRNVTITGSTSETDAGLTNFDTASAFNTIVAGNAGGDCEDELDAGINNIASDGSCGPGFAVADPQLGPLQANGGPTQTHLPALSSPATNAGSNDGCPGVDQRGESRPQNGTCDVGAVERTPFELEEVSVIVGPGGGVTTDGEGDGAVPLDPVETTVTHPEGGIVSISEGPGPAGFGFLGQTVQLGGPAATPPGWIEIRFRIDASAVPPGQTAETIEIAKDGVPVLDCTGPGASPDPCVFLRHYVDDDIEIGVRTSTFSEWTFAPGSEPAPNPRIRAAITNDFLNLEGWLPNDTLNITIGDFSGTVTTDGNGSATVHRSVHGLDIVPGMTITATDGTSSREFVVEPVTFGALDPDTNTASGTAAPNEFVEVFLHEGGPGAPVSEVKSTNADAFGDWSVTFDTDISIGMSAEAWTYDDDGDGGFAHFHLRSPHIHASLTNDYVFLFDFQPGEDVAITIGGYTDVITVNENGFANIQRSTHGQDLVPGTFIDAQGEFATKELALEFVAIDELNPVADSISGRANPGAEVQIFVNQGGTQIAQTTVTADVEGDWFFVFDEDIQYGMGASADVVDADGDRSRADAFLQRPEIHADYLGDHVFLGGWTGTGPVSLTIDGFTTTVPVDGNGNAQVPKSVHGRDFGVGSTLNATQGFRDKTLVIEAVTLNQVNPGATSASGTAPPNRQVDVIVFRNPSQLAFVSTTSDGVGNWSVSLGVTLAGGDFVHADLRDPDGDISRFGRSVRLPQINGSLNQNFIGLNEWMPGPVTVTFADQTRTAVIGETGFGFLNTEQVAFDLVPGLTITATQNPTKVLTLVNITAIPDAAADTVSGTAPPNAQVNVNIFTTPCCGPSRTTTADGSGDWSVSFAGDFDLQGGTQGEASTPDVDGDRTSFNWTVPPETTIDSGPTGTSTNDGDTFTFSSSTTGVQFQCALDGAGFTQCASPRKVYVANGSHTFRVRAVKNGVPDPTPAERTWTAAIPAPPDGTIRVDLGPQFAFSSLDPASPGALDNSGQVLRATCATLVGYEDANGSMTLVPEAATAMPVVSPDHRTYTFTIRPDWAFADGTPLTAYSFADAITRGISTAVNPADFEAYALIQGAAAYRSGESATVTGVLVIDDYTLQITLTQAHYDFLHQLATRWYCPVPPETPHTPLPYVMGSGPYTVDSFSSTEVILVRNAFYGGERPAGFDTIEINVGVELAQATARALAGTSDYAVSNGPAQPDTDALFASHGPGADPQRFFVNPSSLQQNLFFNVTRPGLNDVRIRRAINIALNRLAIRTALAAGQVNGGTPTDQFLHSGHPGFQDVAVYAFGGDLAQAQQLVEDAGYTLESPLTVNLRTTAGNAPRAAAAQLIKDTLAQIGINVNVEFFPAGQLFGSLLPSHDFDITLFAWVGGGGTGDFMKTIFRTGGFNNFSQFSNAGIDAQIDAALGGIPPDGDAAWAQIDQDLAANHAPGAALMVANDRDLFSDRVSCQAHNPATGMSLAALCPATTTYVVTNTNDSGEGSLRQAIIDSNTDAGAGEIVFEIDGAGPHTIQPLTALPAIVDEVLIDGYSQEGAQPHVETPGSTGLQNAVLKIEIDNSLVSDADAHAALLITGANSTVRGLVLNKGIYGLRIEGEGATGNLVSGNFLGTNPAGTAAKTNDIYGVVISQDASDNTVDGNLISGNTGIDGDNGDGVALALGAHNNTVSNNWIGTAKNGVDLVPNAGGVAIFSGAHDNLVGGPTFPSNFIAGNTQNGVIVHMEASDDNRIERNFIGFSWVFSETDRRDLGNSGNGVQVLEADGTQIIGNTIANNGQDGVNILFDATGNTIHSRMRNNGGLGIDLGTNGVTPNDPLDADTGPNNLQNFPDVTSAEISEEGGQVNVAGTFDSAPNQTYTIEIFQGTVCDTSGFGEGPSIRGTVSVTTDETGHATFLHSYVPNEGEVAAGTVVTATATDAAGNTSELSQCDMVLAPDGGAQSLNLTVDETSGGVGAASVPLESVPPEFFPIAAGAPQAAPIPSSAVGAAPIPSSPIPSSPIPSSPIPSSPIPSSPIPSSGLDGVPDFVLDQVLLSSIPGVDWATILGTAAPLQTLTLADVKDDLVASSATVGDLGLERTVFRNARFLSFFFGGTTLDKIPPFTQEAWCALLTSCDGVDVTQTTVLGLDLAGYLGDEDWSMLGDVTIGEIDSGVASTPIPSSPIPSSPIPSSAILQTTVSQVLIRAVPIPSSVVDCTVMDCTPTSTQTLGDAAEAGAILDTATWADILAVLGDREMAEFVTAYIGLENLPWESWPFDGFQLFSGTGESLHYHLDTSIVCPAAETTTANVLLGHGFVIEPGSSTLRVGAVGLASPISDPTTHPVNGATWTLTGLTCPFGATFLPLRINFEALTGFRLGTFEAEVSVTGGSFTHDASGEAPTTVVQNGEIDDDPDVSPMVAKDTLVIGSLPAGDRLDSRRFSLDGLEVGSVVQVYLRPPDDTDYDLYLSKPQQDTLLSSPIPSSPIPSSPIPSSPLEDQGSSVNTESANLPTEGLAEAPIPSSEISSSSISRSDEVEIARVVVDTDDTGDLKIVVAGYNGDYSEDAYTLRVKVIPPPDLPECQPRSFAFAGTNGTLPVGVDSDTRTLFLVNKSSMEKTYGAAEVSSLLTRLGDVAARDDVDGAVVEIDGDSEVRAAKTAWDAEPCSVDLANDYVAEINELLAGYRGTLSGLESIVIVGADEQIAMARVPDLVADTNESTAAADLEFTTVGGTVNNALYSSLATGHVLTDAAYGASTQIPFLGRELYLEEDAVGRLVETPTEIVGQLDQYIASEGLLDLQSSFTTGYDFMQDGATEVDANLASVVGAGNNDSTINDTWGPGTLSGKLSGAEAGPDVFSPNAHANHYQLLPATEALSDLLPSSLLPALGATPQFPGAVIFTMGCHAGLNVADTLPDGGLAERQRDWAQGFLQNRTAVYVANTGYGYGHYEAVALSERLMALFAENLATSTGVGAAWVEAKQEYFATMGAYDVYDEKALIEATFYGLPFWRLDAGTVATLAANTASDDVGPPALELDPLGSGLQIRSYSSTPTLTRNDVEGRGSYWTPPNGDIEFHHRRSLQPRLTFRAPTSGQLSAHGVRVTALQTGDVGEVDALYGNATIANAANEPEPDIVDTFWPASPISLHRLPSGNANVVFVAGQSRPNDVQRLFTHAEFDVLYSSSNDLLAPEILGSGAVFTANDTTFWVQSRGGGVRAFVLYTTGTSDWMYLQLAPVAGVPGLFAATAEVAGGEVDFAAGVEDAAGNVGYIFNKGALLTPVTPQEAEASLSVSITSPAQGEQVLLGQPLTAVYGCASAAGVESCQGPVASGGQVATGTAGTHNFTVTGSDLADNEASATHTYTVGYRFSGFRPPVGPGLNSVKGGQTVPIKWQLRDYSNGFVRALSSVRSITSRPIACPGASSTTISESATGTQVGLRYDTTSEQFVYDWRTDRAWVGTCRQLVVELTDGSQRTADFAIR